MDRECGICRVCGCTVYNASAYDILVDDEFDGIKGIVKAMSERFPCHSVKILIEVKEKT